MRRFGYSLLLLCLIFCTAGPAGCDDTYNEKDMDRLFIFTKTVMDIVSSEYIGAEAPKEIEKKKIREIVVKNNTDFEELKFLDRYEMKIVSDGKQMGAVLWDAKNNRKLIQDLRCTLKLDDAVWRTVSYGSEFNLSFEACR